MVFNAIDVNLCYNINARTDKKMSRFGVWIDAVILPRFPWFLQMSAVIFATF